MYKSILVAVDGSDPANRALRVGAELAGMSDAKLNLVYVVDSNNMDIAEDLRHMSEVEHIVDPSPRNLVSLSDAPVNLFKSINEASAESQRTFYLFADYVVKQAKIEAEEAGAKNVAFKLFGAELAIQANIGIIAICPSGDSSAVFTKAINCASTTPLVIAAVHSCNP
jgi:nucleotide-binding universal stress UspA family protein